MEKPIKLTKHDLKVFNFASTEEIRPLICHVLVRPGLYDKYPEMLATDSYIGMVHTVVDGESENAEFEPFLVPAKVLKQLYALCGTYRLKANRRFKGIKITDIVELYNTHAIIPTLNLRIDFAQPEGKYPELDKLIKDNITGAKTNTAILNANYMAKVAKFVSTHPLSNTGTFEMRVNDKLQPIEFIGKYSYGVVMPVRS